MKYFHTALLIFVIYLSPLNGQKICPAGKSNTQPDCNEKNPCPLGSICYRNNKKSFCCGDIDTFCPTKMHAINNNKEDTYLWGPSEVTGKENWYNVSLGNETVACHCEVSESSKPKQCTLNSDCHVNKDEFCGASHHPTYPGQLDRSGPNGAPLRFCYQSQSFGTNVKPLINPTKTELIGCDNHSECIQDGGAQAFCFIMDVSKEFQIADNKGKITRKKGFCSMAHVCDPEKHISIVGTLSKNNSFCQKNEDCEESENAKKNPGKNSECISIPKIKDARVCCSRKYEESNVCQVGKLERPSKTCSTFEDCNGGKNNTIMNKWCDEKGKHCCQDEAKELWSCPDGATPIYNEPKCEDVSPIDVESGKCSQDGGICRYGHCCPQLMRKNETEFSMALKQYVTNIACKSDEPVPEHFNYAFCDPDSMKVVILGTLTVDGQEIGTDGERCSTNKECKENEVCIKRMKDDRLCIWNPLKEYIYSNLWWYMLAASIVGVFVFAGIAVRCYIADRRQNGSDSPKIDKIGSDSPNLKAKTGNNNDKKTEIKAGKKIALKVEKALVDKKYNKLEKVQKDEKKDKNVKTDEKKVKKVKKDEKKIDNVCTIVLNQKDANSNFPFLPFDRTVYENVHHPAVHGRSMDSASNGLITDPRKTQFMGNTDRAVERERAQKLLDYDEKNFKEANEESTSSIENKKQTVKICEDKCQLYETNEVSTIDEDRKQEEKEDDDIM